MTQIYRFTERCVLVAQTFTGDRDESAVPNGDDGFADYALVSLHCLRIHLDTTYRMNDYRPPEGDAANSPGDRPQGGRSPREFREIALMCVVYNIKRSIKQ